MKRFIQAHQKLTIASVLIAVLCLGAYLRLYKISEYMTFLGDEGRDMLVVKRMIVDHKFTLLGPTASVGGFFLGPIYYYFMLPFLWLWRLDPTGPAVMVGLFGIATVYLIYRLGRELFDPWVGLTAAGLYAVSPLVIAYSRSSWNPNVVPFFSTLLIYFLWKSATTNKTFYIFWAGVILGIGLQLHYLFSFLGVVTAVWFIFFARPKSFTRLCLLLLGGFALGYGPFLLFEIRHGFPNTMTVIRFVMEGKDTGFSLTTFFKNINDVTFRLFGRLVFRYPQPEWWDRFGPWQQFLWLTGTRLTIFTGIGTSAWLAFHKKTTDKSKRAGQLLLLWFGSVILLFGFYKRGIFDYYFGIVFALPFILVATSLWFLSRLKLIGAFLAYGVIGVLLFYNWQGRPYLFPPNNQLAQAKLIAKEAFDKTGSEPFNFALLTGNNSDHAYRYFFEIWGKPPVTIENEVIDPERKTVTDELIVICELPKPECKPLGHPLWEIAGFGRAEIVGEWDVPFVTIFKMVHYRGEKK